MTQDNGPDGLGGTDSASNVRPLFSDRTTAAGLPPQPDVVQALERLLEDARSGQITALGVVALSPNDGYLNGTWGAIPYTRMVGALEDLKFLVLQRQLQQNPRLW